MGTQSGSQQLKYISTETNKEGEKGSFVSFSWMEIVWSALGYSAQAESLLASALLLVLPV